MSRRHFNVGNTLVVVGWDPPFQSYFAQVYFADNNNDDDMPDIDIGLVGGVPYLTNLAVALEKHNIGIPDDTIKNLADDKERDV